MPSLVVVGVNDELVDSGRCARVGRGVPAARFVEMKGANHFFWAKYDPLDSHRLRLPGRGPLTRAGDVWSRSEVSRTSAF